MQNREPPPSPEETISIVRRIAADWRSIAEGQLQNGVFTRPEFDRFCSRMEEGIIDGIRVGSSSRPMSDFSPPVSKTFRHFKRWVPFGPHEERCVSTRRLWLTSRVALNELRTNKHSMPPPTVQPSFRPTVD